MQHACLIKAYIEILLLLSAETPERFNPYGSIIMIAANFHAKQPEFKYKAHTCTLFIH